MQFESKLEFPNEEMPEDTFKKNPENTPKPTPNIEIPKITEFTEKQSQKLIANSNSLYEEIYGKKSRVSIGYQHKQILFMVIEYYDQNIKEFSNNSRMSKGDLRYIAKQIIQGLLSAHKKKICHRDLKLQNILIKKYS
jgi:serine/threonine protein kinase